MLEGYSEIPDIILDKAYHSLLYNNSSVSEIDKIIVRQHKYIQKHGNFKIKTEETNDNLICKLYIKNKKYKCTIPLNYEEVISKVYPFGNVKFTDVQLMAVSFQEQSSWAKESFYVSYWANPIKIDEGNGFKNIDEPWVENKIKILTQFYVPRKLIIEETGLEEVVTNESSKNKFKPVDVRNFTHCKTPNPWIKYSMGVLYEDESVAQNLFEHDDIYGSKENYHLTPPEEMP